MSLHTLLHVHSFTVIVSYLGIGQPPLQLRFITFHTLFINVYITSQVLLPSAARLMHFCYCKEWGGIVVKSHPSNDPRPPHSFHACYIMNYVICHTSYFSGSASRARVTSPRIGGLAQIRTEAAIVTSGRKDTE